MSLIVLDCDGVLVDSEKVAHAKFIQLLGNRGINIDEEKCQKEFTGLTVKAIYARLSEQFNQTFSAAEIDYLERQIEEDLFLNVKAIPEVEKLLQTLKTLNLEFCVASNSNPMRIRGSLKTAGLLPWFIDENIFSYTMVAKGKPAPDLFLHAAKTLNYSPSDCLVIEDSFSGVQAANAAGMRSIAFFGAQHAQHDWYRDKVLEQKPHVACETMPEVIDKLTNIFLLSEQK